MGHAGERSASGDEPSPPGAKLTVHPKVMPPWTAVVFGWMLLTLLATPMARGDEESPVTRLVDLGTNSPMPLAPETLTKLAGARQIPEDQTNAAFAGDAVLLNDKLAVVFRTAGLGAEVYAKTAAGFKWRAEVGHSPNLSWALEPAGSLKILENTAGGVTLEETFKGLAAAILRFRLIAGEAILEVRWVESPAATPVEGGGARRHLNPGFFHWQSQGRHLVIPDFFGDDMIYGAGDFRRDLCLPTENFCLQLIEGGDAMVMGVWRSREQQAWIAKARAQTEGEPVSTRVECRKDQSFWLAFIESPGLWQALPGPAQTATPFAAKWRASLSGRDNLADSWDLERGPRAEQSAHQHVGPVLVYPIDRTPATPLTATCPTDVMRNTLGVGPCQYILACEGMGAQGDPTPNSVMGWVEKQFEQKKEKKTADDIKERLELMCKHVAEARTRTERYRDFAALVRKTPKPLPSVDPGDPMARDLEQFAVAGLGDDSAPGRARELAAQVGALIGRDDSLAACRQAGEHLRVIGAVQDRALARCRMAVRRLKAQSLMQAVSPDARVNVAVAKELSILAEAILKTP